MAPGAWSLATLPPVEPDRIAALLAPFVSNSGESLLRALSTYLDLLLQWNARLNLTAVRDPEQIVTRHFGESLFAASHLFVSSGDRQPGTGNYLLDLGSGAGFPGVPIKLWAPSLQVTLIESKQRKATFLRELLRALALPGAEVFCGRAEDFSPPASGGMTITLRAVERFDDVLPIAAGLLRKHLAGPGKGRPARLALLIGSAQVERAHALLPEFAWNDPVPIPQSSSRVLLSGSPPA